MISVVVIIAGSLIAQKKEGEKYYKTYGCVGFFVLICGFVLMIAGAFIESNAIISNATV